MKMHCYLLAAGLWLACTPAVRAQTDAALARSKGTEAVKLMDAGQLGPSRKLLKEAQKLDPGNITYPYEMAFSYYVAKDYKQAVKLLEPLSNSPEATEHIFQLLGNSYDFLGQPQRAIATYEAGLQKLPKSGPLHLELGNMQLAQKKYDKAVEYYEKGIAADPTFPSNYYRAARLHLGSSDELWGMLYGELFMNLERNSARTAEMSALLYKTYRSEITFPNDSSTSVSFSSNVMTPEQLGGSKLKLPYGMVYEMTLMLATLGERQVNLKSLSNIRNRFISNYFEQKRNLEYGNILFDYQRDIEAAGHAEAYNYWLLMKGDETGFNQWRTANPDKWAAFISWYPEHPILLTPTHKFYRQQYD